MKLIAKPFGMLLMWLYNLTGNYGAAVLIFALIVKLILLPFQMKSKKGTMRMSRMTPKLKELERRHGANQRKYQEEVQKLYKEEHCSPMSGCVWSLIPFPILFALYYAIRYPLTTMMGVAEDLLAEGGAIAVKLAELGYETPKMRAAYEQIAQSQFITEHFSDFAGITDKLAPVNYKFLGIDLGSVPQWNFFSQVDWSDTSSWAPALGLFLIPIVSASLSLLQMKVGQKANPAPETAQQAQQQKQMQSMMWMMPLMSIWICFSMPGSLGLYWIAGSVFAIIQEAILNKHYGKILDREDAERLEANRLKEAEIERKHQETERRQAEGSTERNANTSKKKLQAQQKAESDAIKAAAIRAEKQERRERLGIKDAPIPESQVGNRKYARGRNYKADRFSNPEAAVTADTAETIEASAQAAEAAVEEAAEVAYDVTETAAETMEEAAAETAADVTETVADVTETAAEAVSEAVSEIEEAAAENE